MWGPFISPARALQRATSDTQPIAAAVATHNPVKPELVTVRGVEIISTGIEYPLASGPTTFTEDDLQAAVAAQDDPAIQQPRIKIGHTDPRFDGEPALGKVTEMRLSEDRQTVVGDLVGVPRWLADIMASAFPSRSIEGNFEVETVTGHKWQLVIDALALLGVMWPGVSTLEDIQALYAPEGPDGVEVFESFEAKEAEVGASARVAAHRSVQAAVNVEDVRRSYYESLEADQMWWWVRAVLLDPNELIVDDDEGHLFRVPFKVNGEEASFDDPVEVKIQYVDQKSSTKARMERTATLAVAASKGDLTVAYASRSESRPESSDKEETGMTPEQIRLLRQRLGLSEEQLPDDATEDQINEVLSAQPEPETDPPASGGESDEGEEGEVENEPGGEEAQPDAEPAGVAAGMVQVPAAEWARTQADLQRVTARTDREESAERERTVDEAIRAGKVRPADRPSYLNGINNPATREQYTQLLTASVEKGGLAPNIVPVSERGRGATDQDVEAAASAYPSDWLSPAERARAGSSDRVTQAQEA